YELAVRQIAALRIPPLGRRPSDALHAVLHLERLFRHGAVPPAPLVDTTLDLDVQQAVATMVADALAGLEERGAGNAAAIVVERGTNRVVAWVGSAGYFDNRHAGAYDYARVPRSPGSTLKPFLYALTLERLVGAYTVLAGDGRAGELVWYRGQPAAAPRRLLSEDTARLVTLFLSDPMARLPTFPRMGPSEYPFPVAVKTGTSSRYRDA